MSRTREAQALPTGDEKRRAVRQMFDDIAPRYDLVNRVMTFGMDVGWRRRTVAALGLPPGSVVLDLASGTGDLCHELRKSKLRPVAADLSVGMLRNATHTEPREQADAARLPHPDGSFDGMVCGFALRNFVDLASVLAESARVVAPGGRIALLEVAIPENAVLRAGHSLYFRRIVPLLGGWLGRNRKAYSYLPRSTAYLPPVAELLEIVAAAGFVSVQRKLLGPRVAQLITATRRDS